MRPREVSATEAARSLGDLLARVRYRGEIFLIRRGKHIVASLGPSPVTGVTGRVLAERRSARRRMSAREAAGFARDVGRIRERLNVPPKDPWES
ncbi:MAG: hypothetical protein HYY06_03925 [Deltaproteobacteria bacterium]|nr:hypothetical protein [Deltaproteobacteria bacterium]